MLTLHFARRRRSGNAFPRSRRRHDSLAARFAFVDHAYTVAMLLVALVMSLMPRLALAQTPEVDAHEGELLLSAIAGLDRWTDPVDFTGWSAGLDLLATDGLFRPGVSSTVGWDGLPSLAQLESLRKGNTATADSLLDNAGALSVNPYFEIQVPVLGPSDDNSSRMATSGITLHPAADEPLGLSLVLRASQLWVVALSDGFDDFTETYAGIGLSFVRPVWGVRALALWGSSSRLDKIFLEKNIRARIRLQFSWRGLPGPVRGQRTSVFLAFESDEMWGTLPQKLKPLAAETFSLGLQVPILRITAR